MTTTFHFLLFDFRKFSFIFTNYCGVKKIILHKLCKNKKDLIQNITKADLLFLDMEINNENGIDIGLELENNRFRIQYDYYSYIHSQKIYSDAGEHTTINYNLNDYLKLNYTHQNFDRVKSNYGIDFQLDKRTNISFIHDNGHGYKVYVYYDVFGDKNSFLNKKAIQHKIDNKQHIKHEII